MDKFYAVDIHKINYKFIEMGKNNDNIKNNKINKNINNKNNVKKLQKKLQKNTSWDNFMKFESFWVL